MERVSRDRARRRCGTTPYSARTPAGFVFVFVWIQGLGKSLVAKALLEILRGIGLRRRALSSLEGDQFRLNDLSGQIEELLRAVVLSAE